MGPMNLLAELDQLTLEPAAKTRWLREDKHLGNRSW